MKTSQTLGLLIALIYNVTAFGALVTFNDRASFLAATSSVTTIDFGGIASNGSFTTFTTPQGLTLSDDNFCCTPYTGRGDNVASLSSPVSGVGTNSRIELTLPDGINAVGMDLFGVTVGDVGPGSQTDTVQIKVGTETFLAPTVAVGVGNGRVFFGFISDDAISSFSVGPTRTDIPTATDVVDFTFGVAAPVPLPGAALLLGSALGVFGCMRRRDG